MMLDGQAMEAFVAMAERYRAAQRLLSRLVDRDAAAAGVLGTRAAATVRTGGWITTLAFSAGLLVLILASVVLRRAIRMSEVPVATPIARVYGEPVLEVPQDLYIPPDALQVFLETFEGPLDLLLT